MIVIIIIIAHHGDGVRFEEGCWTEDSEVGHVGEGVNDGHQGDGYPDGPRQISDEIQNNDKTVEENRR